MVRTRQRAAQKVKSLLFKKKEPTPKQLEKAEEAFLEQEELLLLDREEEEEDNVEEEEEERDDKIQKKSSIRRGVVFLSHIPHGFYEAEMKKYFSQFGKVFRVILSRSPKTGKSQHYAYIEFANQKIASIVAKTMNGYLLFECQLVCKVVPREKHYMIFANAKKRKMQPLSTRKQAYLQQNGAKAETESQRTPKSWLNQLLEAAQQWKAMGIHYDISGLIEKEKLSTSIVQ